MVSTGGHRSRESWTRVLDCAMVGRASTRGQTFTVEAV
jgi:hypothetical protein